MIPTATSPGMNMNSRAWYVTQYGFADYANVYNVSISYGSPNTRYGNSAIDVGINGGVGNNYYAVVDDSYGWNSPDTGFG